MDHHSKLTKYKHGRSHRFRTLFAAALLLAGLTLSVLSPASHVAATDIADALPFSVNDGYAEVGCTWNNGYTQNGSPYHPYIAIDFIIGDGTTVAPGGSSIAVYAAGAGEIYDAIGDCTTDCDTRGRFVEIDHDAGAGGRHSRYLHLSSVSVAKHDTVARGQLIGYTGDTNGNGVHHLHYDETVDGTKVDPGPMIAIQNGSPVSYPSAINSAYDSWDDVPSWSDKWVWSEGFASPDTDNDGVNSPQDQCPSVPGIAALQGCPPKDIDRDGIADLVIVNTTNTGSGVTETHELAGSGGYVNWLGHQATGVGYLNATQQTFMADVNADYRPDLVAVNTASTGSGKVEVHALDGSTGFSTWQAHWVTPLNYLTASQRLAMGDGNADKIADLFVINADGAQNGSGKVEVHPLSGASHYSAWIGHYVVTPLTSLSSTQRVMMGG